MTKNPSLAETNPEIAKQWHPTLNGDLTPKNVTPDSGKNIWWKCEKETKNDSHLYKTTIVNRVMGVACPMCHTINIKKKMTREGFNYDNFLSTVCSSKTSFLHVISRKKANEKSRIFFINCESARNVVKLFLFT